MSLFDDIGTLIDDIGSGSRTTQNVSATGGAANVQVNPVIVNQLDTTGLGQSLQAPLQAFRDALVQDANTGAAAQVAAADRYAAASVASSQVAAQAQGSTVKAITDAVSSLGTTLAAATSGRNAQIDKLTMVVTLLGLAWAAMRYFK